MMKTLLHDYIKYNCWANNILTDRVLILDSDKVYKTSASSFPSIGLTLLHIRNAEDFWYHVISEGRVDVAEEQLIELPIGKVVQELLDSSGKMKERFLQFSEEELARKIRGPQFSASRSHFILHCINHNTYHRGQIITMMRQLEETDQIPNTDFDTYLWNLGLT
jgi:uncharacterized damage-inducible protein DinB